jgi:hypothetical protein
MEAVSRLNVEHDGELGARRDGRIGHERRDCVMETFESYPLTGSVAYLGKLRVAQVRAQNESGGFASLRDLRELPDLRAGFVPKASGRSVQLHRRPGCSATLVVVLLTVLVAPAWRRSTAGAQISPPR